MSKHIVVYEVLAALRKAPPPREKRSKHINTKDKDLTPKKNAIGLMAKNSKSKKVANLNLPLEKRSKHINAKDKDLTPKKNAIGLMAKNSKSEKVANLNLPRETRSKHINFFFLKIMSFLKYLFFFLKIISFLKYHRYVRNLDISQQDTCHHMHNMMAQPRCGIDMSRSRFFVKY